MGFSRSPRIDPALVTLAGSQFNTHTSMAMTLAFKSAIYFFIYLTTPSCFYNSCFISWLRTESPFFSALITSLVVCSMSLLACWRSASSYWICSWYAAIRAAELPLYLPLSKFIKLVANCSDFRESVNTRSFLAFLLGEVYLESGGGIILESGGS